MCQIVHEDNTKWQIKRNYLGEQSVPHLRIQPSIRQDQGVRRRPPMAIQIMRYALHITLLLYKFMMDV